MTVSFSLRETTVFSDEGSVYPHGAAPTSSPSASCTRAGNTAS